jgi:hypothetical protein
VTNLEQAMDILAPQVVDETFNGSDVNIQFPTAVVLVSNQSKSIVLFHFLSWSIAFSHKCD